MTPRCFRSPCTSGTMATVPISPPFPSCAPSPTTLPRPSAGVLPLWAASSHCVWVSALMWRVPAARWTTRSQTWTKKPPTEVFPARLGCPQRTRRIRLHQSGSSTSFNAFPPLLQCNINVKGQKSLVCFSKFNLVCGQERKTLGLPSNNLLCRPSVLFSSFSILKNYKHWGCVSAVRI